MATELVHWCDWHIADESATRAVATITRTAVLDGVEYLVELCEECDVKRYQPLATFVQTFGLSDRKAKQRERDRARVKRPLHPDDDGTSLRCPIPGCGFAAVNRTGLGAHGWHGHNAHGLSALWEAAAAARG